MAKHKGQDQTEELEKYLTNDFNLSIYYDLTDGDDEGLFEPLEFFKLFYSQYEFIKENTSKPLTVIKSLHRLKLSDDQKYFLFYYLSEKIDKSITGLESNQQIAVCGKLIKKEFDRLDDELYGSSEEDNEDEEDNEEKPAKQEVEQDDWPKVKQHLLTLPDMTAKLKYLLDVKTECEQSDQRASNWHGFVRKCELEIRKLERQRALDRSATRGISNGSKEKRARGGTQYQNHLAIHYLLLYAKANCKNTKKAKFASFLTGYGEESFRQQWSNIHRKADESGHIWERDMQIVRDYFEELGLREITVLIDNDLDSEREKL